MSHVVISGGSDGLGKAIAEVLVRDHTVTILSPSAEKLQAAAQAIGCNYAVCDISRPDDITATVRSLAAIDCLVNNAGLWIQGPLVTNDIKHIQKVIDVNVSGAILLTQAVLPQMIKQGAGRIFMVNSQGGLYAKADRSVYTASKWALTGFTKSLQSELAPHGIGVTGVYPGKLATEMFSKMGIEKDMSDALSPHEVARAIAFILSCDPTTFYPEIGIKHLNG